MTTWVLLFVTMYGRIVVPGIASEKACHDLAEAMSKDKAVTFTIDTPPKYFTDRARCFSYEASK